jgi:hypothetical protein
MHPSVTSPFLPAARLLEAGYRSVSWPCGYGGAVAYSLYFWRSAAVPASDEATYAALCDGDWMRVVAAPEVLEFRRDLIASDPHWMDAAFLPRSGAGVPQDRYLALVLSQAPSEEALRDLRYVALRNRLTMFDPQAATSL